MTTSIIFEHGRSTLVTQHQPSQNGLPLNIGLGATVHHFPLNSSQINYTAPQGSHQGVSSGYVQKRHMVPTAVLVTHLVYSTGFEYHVLCQPL